MIKIVLEDSKNKLFQIIRDLSEERELHIRRNIIVLNEIDLQYIVSFWDEKDGFRLKNNGYKQDLALYDRAIINYNNVSRETRLQAWIK